MPNTNRATLPPGQILLVYEAADTTGEASTYNDTTVPPLQPSALNADMVYVLVLEKKVNVPGVITQVFPRTVDCPLFQV